MVRRQRERAKGRRSAKHFAQIPCEVLQAPVTVALDHCAFRLLVLLAGQYRGTNNGALGITQRQAVEFGIRSKDGHAAGLRALQDHGLIVMTEQASRTPPRPARFALTWLPVDDTKHSTAARTPTFDYRGLEPPPKRRRKRDPTTVQQSRG